ncbi:acetolactate synthase isoform A [Chlorella sorokiniana]|uniref:Acetolactate synthase n=1 Tax=Chlorella sorokiniana TaxID=3076 RepID=A0A2P6TBH4_CHLSO|nr:acetolactate synthase isoform A [Chlorella sorokiniana]|eukprot:PRW05900.1 acetolactate synthase isoform A [Chlorella sorokiniana]
MTAACSAAQAASAALAAAQRPRAGKALPTQFAPSRIPQRPHSSRPERAALQTCATMAKDFSNKASAAELEAARQAAAASLASEPPKEWVDRFAGQARKGCDILVQALEREGVDTLFAYPGGASMEIHQALTRSETIRNILCRHEQGEIFAAEGYAKVTGRVGVCIATSGPGATNLVTGLADALLDSVPLVAITGQVPRKLIGSDAFQETPIVEVTRQITKHNFLVMDVKDIPRVIKEAFYLARTGRPGPVLVDIPKDVQQTLDVPDWDAPMSISAYISRLPPPPKEQQIQAVAVVEAIRQSKRPVLYVGGGCVDSAPEIKEFVERTGIPVAQTLMALGAFPEQDPMSLQMLGMHGTVTANYAVNEADLLLAFGARFDDRVTGKLEAFAANARIVHIDIDPAEIHKNKDAHIPICSDVKPALQMLNRALADSPVDRSHYGEWVAEYGEWVAEVLAMKEEHPLSYPHHEDVIMPQWAIEVLYEESKGDAIITTGVGQHQMWAAQFYKKREPRRWVTSGGLGSMGFGLPSALGAAAAFDGQDGRPKKIVVDIDGDGSFIMNCQELATAAVEKLNTKCFILNNQYLGMVMQWEDRFYKANRAHTYLGKPESEYQVTGDESDIFPDFVKMAGAFNVPAKRVRHPSELRAAIREMLDTEGPYLLDVMVPHIQHVLPMIPGGGSFKDIITKGDGTDNSRTASSKHTSGTGTNGTSEPPKPARKRGRPLTPVPDVDAEQLLHRLGLSGTVNPAALLRKLRKLRGVRQQGVLGNAAAVTAYLLSPAVGLTAPQAGQLLERCPYLFSWPAEQRAAVLFGELLGSGVTAPAAAQCFVAYPKAAETTTLAPGLAELAAILAHSEEKQGGKGRKAAYLAVHRTVAALLTKIPNAVMLVCQRAGYLQQRAAELQQAGFTATDVAALAWQRSELLQRDGAAKLASTAAIVQQELGLPRAQVVSMATRTSATWLLSSEETVRARAAAMAQGFGQGPAAAMLLRSSSALGVEPAVWQRNLRYMAACGVADPKMVLRQSPNLLHFDHGAPGFLQRRLLLQRCFQLTAAQLYGAPSYLTQISADKLAQRLQFVEQRGQAQRLVAAAPAAPAIPASSTLKLSHLLRGVPQFLAAMGVSQAEWEAWAAANPPAACPLYRWAQQAAAEEAVRLAAALPPELAQRERRQHSAAPRSRRQEVQLTN